MQITKDSAEGLLILAVGLAAFWVIWRAKTAISQVAADVVPFVDPTSDQNIAYQGANKIIQQLPGATDSSTVGTWIYDITHQAQDTSAPAYKTVFNSIGNTGGATGSW